MGKVFGRRAALREVTLTLDEGSCLVLLGPNGAGKTTLLRIAAGLARPSAGRVVFEGSGDDAPARLRPHVGYLAHQSLLYDALTARQNLTFFARLYGLAAPGERAAQLLRHVELEPHADRSVASLSRGMQQRLALARALVHAPAILLLDEPYANLDASGLWLLSATLRELKARGATILIATHAFETPLEIADAVAILAEGELRHHGPRGALSPAELARLYAIATQGTGAAFTSPAARQGTTAAVSDAGSPSRPLEAPPEARSGGAGRLLALLAKDLLLEWRRKQQVAAMGVFALLAAVLFVFAVDPTPQELVRLGPGALWISFLFAGTLGLAKIFAPEERNAALTALLLAPLDRTGLFLAKAASVALFMGLMEALMTPVFFALFDLPLLSILLPFALVAALATIGFCLAGTLFAFLTSRTAARELLLPILLLPLTLPLLIAAAKATRILLEGPGGPQAGDLQLWLALMGAFDAVFGWLCCWAFERAVEE